MLTPSVAGKYLVTVKIANAYTDAFPTIPTEINGSPFTVTCIDPSKEPVPDEPIPDKPKQSNEKPTDPVASLINWFFDKIIFVVVVIALVYVIYLYFIKKPDPPQVDYKTKDDSSKDSLMIVVLE